MDTCFLFFLFFLYLDISKSGNVQNNELFQREIGLLMWRRWFDPWSSVDWVERVLIYFNFSFEKIFRSYDISQRFRLTGIKCISVWHLIRCRQKDVTQVMKIFLLFLSVDNFKHHQSEPFKFFYFPFLIVGTRKSS